MDSLDIGYTQSYSKHDHFYLHTHNKYEIIFFIGGDVDYIVEGAVYPLEPDDIIIIRPNEMHRALVKNDLPPYRRVVMHIDDDFFTALECERYTSVFNNRAAGTKNRISADIVHACGISELFSRLREYTNGYSDFSVPVVNGAVLELLHILNTISITESVLSDRVQKVIAYINENFASEITLASIADIFYVSKSHLSREFRQRTGYTVSEYVNRKRIENVKILCKAGASLGNACVNSGFNDYSAFYRAVQKACNTSPKKWLENEAKHYKLY